MGVAAKLHAIKPEADGGNPWCRGSAQDRLRSAGEPLGPDAAGLQLRSARTRVRYEVHRFSQPKRRVSLDPYTKPACCAEKGERAKSWCVVLKGTPPTWKFSFWRSFHPPTSLPPKKTTTTGTPKKNTTPNPQKCRAVENDHFCDTTERASQRLFC